MVQPKVSGMEMPLYEASRFSNVVSVARERRSVGLMSFGAISRGGDCRGCVRAPPEGGRRRRR